MTWIESFKMAIAAIGAHKLRSFLTLVGIIAGVAAIISVMTGVSVVQTTRWSRAQRALGTRTFQVQKCPEGGFNNNRDLNFREIARWPPLTLEHADAIREKVQTVDLVGAELWHYNARVSYRDESTEPSCMICGGTPEYPENNTHFVELGRNLTEEDVGDRPTGRRPRLRYRRASSSPSSTRSARPSRWTAASSRCRAYSRRRSRPWAASSTTTS